MISFLDCQTPNTHAGPWDPCIIVVQVVYHVRRIAQLKRNRSCHSAIWAAFLSKIRTVGGISVERRDPYNKEKMFVSFWLLPRGNTTTSFFALMRTGPHRLLNLVQIKSIDWPRMHDFSPSVLGFVLWCAGRKTYLVCFSWLSAVLFWVKDIKRVFWKRRYATSMFTK